MGKERRSRQVTDDQIRSLTISQRLLGTRDIILIHHTDCEMLTFTDAGFKAQIAAETGIRPPWAAEAFTDVEADVRQSIARIKPACSFPTPTRCVDSCTRWRTEPSPRSADSADRPAD
jgi:carbonic anhydrase